MKYIQRQSKRARAVHLAVVISFLTLFVTGLFVYIPALAAAVGGSIEAIRILHRVAAVVFIAAPLLAALAQPQALADKYHEYFSRWTDEDKEFMRKFVPYMFAPKKVHMPKQGRYKSGQKVADLSIVLFSVLIAVSGVFMWLSGAFPPALIRFMYVLHDGSMIMLGVLIAAHVYLGAGIFQPYRGSARLMFGDGRISEPDARYHWGFWAEEELEKGDNVVEV